MPVAYGTMALHSCIHLPIVCLPNKVTAHPSLRGVHHVPRSAPGLCSLLLIFALSCCGLLLPLQPADVLHEGLQHKCSVSELQFAPLPCLSACQLSRSACKRC